MADSRSRLSSTRCDLQSLALMNIPHNSHRKSLKLEERLVDRQIEQVGRSDARGDKRSPSIVISESIFPAISITIDRDGLDVTTFKCTWTFNRYDCKP
jgi:hypothetical protein